MAGIFQDIKFAIRTLRRNPGVFVVALFTLALAIGSSTAIFSVLKVILLRRFCYEPLLAARVALRYE